MKVYFFSAYVASLETSKHKGLRQNMNYMERGRLTCNKEVTEKVLKVLPGCKIFFSIEQKIDIKLLLVT